MSRYQIQMMTCQNVYVAVTNIILKKITISIRNAHNVEYITLPPKESVMFSFK